MQPRRPPQNYQPQHPPQNYQSQHPPQNYQPQPQAQYYPPQTQPVPAQQYVGQPGAVVVQGQNTGAQAGAAIGITLIVVVVVVVLLVILSAVLYVWANSLAEENNETAYDVTISIGADPDGWGGRQVICDTNGETIGSGQYYGCSFGLNGDGECDITVDVGSGGAVDIYTMTQSNFEKWERGDPYDYFYSLSRTDVHYSSMTGDLNGGEDYVIVVVN